MKSKETLARFDVFLAERGLVFEAIVVGGAALGLLGVITRETRDCDVLHPELSQEIRDVATEFAVQLRQQGDALADNWLNNGPMSLAEVLPAGWKERVELAFEGRALRLQALGRIDMLRSKLFALCDRGIDLPDCIALAPNQEELNFVTPWVEAQDANVDWPAHVRATLEDLQRRLGRGV